MVVDIKHHTTNCINKFTKGICHTLGCGRFPTPYNPTTVGTRKMCGDFNGFVFLENLTIKQPLISEHLAL